MPVTCRLHVASPRRPVAVASSPRHCRRRAPSREPRACRTRRVERTCRQRWFARQMRLAKRWEKAAEKASEKLGQTLRDATEMVREAWADSERCYRDGSRSLGRLGEMLQRWFTETCTRRKTLVRLFVSSCHAKFDPVVCVCVCVCVCSGVRRAREKGCHPSQTLSAFTCDAQRPSLRCGGDSGIRTPWPSVTHARCSPGSRARECVFSHLWCRVPCVPVGGVTGVRECVRR